ncbi:MAG: apolipoprotein N-acyltransferase [Candidatus Brocadiia bacterium]
MNSNERTEDTTGRANVPLRGLLLAAISGGLVYLSFPPADFGWIGFFALVPGLIAVNSVKGTRSRLLCAGVAGATACIPLLAWLSSVTIGGWVALSLYVAAYFSVGYLLAPMMRGEYPAAWPLLFGGVWVGLELIRARFATGFPWLLIGYTQHRFTSFIQVSEVLGVYGVSFLLALINAAVADVFLSMKSGPDLGKDTDGSSARTLPVKSIVRLGIVVAVAGLVAFAGHLRRSTIELEDGPVVGVVQQNFPRLVEELITPPGVVRARKRLEEDGESLTEEERRELERRVARHREQRDEYIRREIARARELSLRLRGRNPDLVAWPETTVQVDLNVAPELYEDPEARALREFAEEVLTSVTGQLGSHLLVGAPTTFAREEGYVSEARYGLDVQHAANSAVLLDPEGDYVERYDKMHLVPFGEYVPLVDMFPFLGVFTPMTRNLTPGDEPVVFELPGGERFSAPICYEAIMPQLMSRYVRRGADFLVNLTDEGWYRYPGELRQHAAMTVFRAVENRSTVIRAANTGISCFISPLGEVYGAVEKRTGDRRVRREVAGVEAQPVQLTDARTLYTRTGDVFALACLLVSLAWGIRILVSRWMIPDGTAESTR